jgi:polyisoprenoid-binding protein YceI
MVVTAVTRRVDGRELPTTGTWEIDASHSLVGFEVRHLMLSKTRGRFSRFSGRLHVAERIEESSVEIAIEADSIDTAHAERDAHLRSNDFVGSAEHPTMTFRSRSVTPASGGKLLVAGDLTIRGVSRPVTLEAEYLGGVSDPWGNERVAFAASALINREDWGMTWNVPLDGSGLVLGKDVRIVIEVEALRAQAAAGGEQAA